MPTLNFKGKAVIETCHHTVPYHRLEFDDNCVLFDFGKSQIEAKRIVRNF